MILFLIIQHKSINIKVTFTVYEYIIVYEYILIYTIIQFDIYIYIYIYIPAGSTWSLSIVETAYPIVNMIQGINKKAVAT